MVHIPRFFLLCFFIPTQPKISLAQVSVLSYYSSLISYYSPNIILTYIDNDWHFDFLSKVFPKITFQSIQNGTRSEYSLTFGLEKIKGEPIKLSKPIFFCFGEYVEQLYFKHNVSIKEPKFAGSLNASLNFKSSDKLMTSKNSQWHILLISQWVDEIFREGAFPEIKSSIQKTVCYLREYSAFTKIKIGVQLRSQDKNEEMFYKNNFGKDVCLLNRKHSDKRSAYKNVAASGLVLSLDSTLALEGYGFGIKTLFVNLTDAPIYKLPVCDICYSDEKNSFEAFSAKINHLINLSDKRYHSQTIQNRKFLMSVDENGISHAKQMLIDSIQLGSATS